MGQASGQCVRCVTRATEIQVVTHGERDEHVTRNAACEGGGRCPLRVNMVSLSKYTSGKHFDTHDNLADSGGELSTLTVKIGMRHQMDHEVLERAHPTAV